VTRVHRVDPTAAGITRRRRGRGFSYEDARGRPIADDATLARIRDLAIPPAWTDVWICRDPEGHLQAAGTDAAGRRQSLYHPAWRERQDVRKFRRVESFARALPSMRADVERVLTSDADDMPKERAIAIAIRLLDRATFRIGSEEYADRNGSFGLATIRKSHVEIDGGTIVFDYVAKGGQRRIQTVRDPLLVPLVERLKRRRTGGLELLAYREGRRWRDLRSADINAALKEALGPDHSAKDFRTWHATVLAALEIARRAVVDEGKGLKERAVRETVRTVAEHMGNTPAVCRASYIDPRVFDRYRAGQTVAHALSDVEASGNEAREAVERAVLHLLAGPDVRAAAA